MERKGTYSRQQRNPDEIGCEAKKHNPGCPCLSCKKPKEACETCSKLTKQHVIPDATAKNILGWTKEQRDDPSNITRLSKPCHKDEDKNIQKKHYELLNQMKAGAVITQEYAMMHIRGILFK